jgi:EAL domain-containing protein (putative c-di-GMP-specific phosphodiesterase class I)
MARALGCRVVAEGVETVDQMRMLEMNDCHEMQGYLFSRPLEAKAFDALLSGRRPLHPMGGAAPAGAPVSTGTRLR